MRTMRLSLEGWRLIVPLALAVFVALVVATPAWASYFIDRVDIDATVDAGGSLVVEETREFDFDGSYHGVYWNIPAGTFKGRSIAPANISAGEVVDGQRVAFSQDSSSLDGTYQISDRGSSVQVKIYSAHTDESAQFWIGYTDAGLVSRWSDTSELYWK